MKIEQTAVEMSWDGDNGHTNYHMLRSEKMRSRRSCGNHRRNHRGHANRINLFAQMIAGGVMRKSGLSYSNVSARR